ncbi:MAG TPA: carbohydrate kinase [Candidatus Acidoferrum sp.]|jgi:fructokinase|nr:carbohydrate kinase [Candidatus Acidoferrum sp.]
MPHKSYNIVGLGELLWDVLPKGKELGGAPANFAYMTSLLGDHGIVASRVGSDALGRTAGRRLERIGLRSKFLQIDTQHPTSTAKVDVDPLGQATFEFTPNSAWDYFEWTPEWQKLASTADAVCFGTLAQRSPQSRATIRSFLQEVGWGTTRIFDVNLRAPFYSAEMFDDSLKLSDVVKLNQDELPIVVKSLGGTFTDEERSARWLRDKYGLRLVCITRGAKGSLLVSSTEVQQHAGIRVSVADTVGSGDAFTAALIYHYLRRASLATMNEAANRMGAWVASQTGATPPRDDYYLQQIRSAVSGEE